MKVGDRFDLPGEQIHGTVHELIPDRFGDDAAAVIQMDDGRWAAVDLRLIEPARITLQ